MPNSPEEWKKIANEFETRWNFPQCIGSIDGKHVAILKPIGSGSEYYNYKGFYSIVLLALVDANYNFLYVNVGCQGRISDGGVFSNTEFRKRMKSDNLHLPRDRPLPGRTKNVPFVFVTDDAFPLERHLLKPYVGPQNKDSKERKYNYRLSRARITVENAFGILSARFRILRTTIQLEPEKAKTIIITCVLLHNFLRKNKSSLIYAPPEYYDREDSDGRFIPGEWRSENQNLTSLEVEEEDAPNPQTTIGKEVRNEFTEYIAQEGSLIWTSNYE